MAAAATIAFAADSIAISQHDRKFTPDHVTIHPGTIVRVMNDDRVTHHLYLDAPAKRFDSGEQPIGKSIDLVFDRTGRFTVRCAIHPTMRLGVAVE
ncbi:MAG: hypothetical protein WDN25_06125 [Acetobacteraceae bacterium]